MNAQLPITTTPRYNFPLPMEHLTLPQHLIELSIRSFQETCYPSENSIETTSPSPLQELADIMDPDYTTQPIKLEVDSTHTLIIGIDVSSIKLGETDTGIILATRGAIVWREANRYFYVRIGPFPFHITGRSRDELRSLLHPHESITFKQRDSLPNILRVQSRLTTLLERWMQAYVNESTRNSLVLWDGSLTAGTPETPIAAMKKLLEETRYENNIVLAFSKATRLLHKGQRLAQTIIEHPAPCMQKVYTNPQHTHPIRSLGNIYIAKLSEGRYAFRLDIDREIPLTHAIEAIQKLLGNELITQSYPETLRLAHIFSTFTAPEVLGLQRCISKESNMKIITQLNVHRLLFGRFGKGPER